MGTSQKLFTEERTLFQKRVNELAGVGTSANAIDSLVRAQIGCRGDENSKKLVGLYDVLGLDGFFDVLDVAEGQVVYFPTMASINESVQSALAFYHKAIKDKKASADEFVCDEETNPSKIEAGAESIREIVESKKTDDPRLVELADLIAKRMSKSKKG
jgi:hypothetical protein